MQEPEDLEKIEKKEEEKRIKDKKKFKFSQRYFEAEKGKIFLTRNSDLHREFKCNFDRAKTSFFRAFNAVFGRIGRSASEEVVLHLISAKCLPCLLYGTDVCPVNKTQQRSFEFTFHRALMKIFKTSSMDVIQDCKTFFNIQEIAALIRVRKLNFLTKFCNFGSAVCQLFATAASSELALLSSGQQQ